MATPRGSVHRDLEQRLRDLEAKVQSLTSVALRREQLEVTSGDFVVSGGGGVVIREGGDLVTQYPSGSDCLTVQDFVDGSTGMLVERDGGGRRLFAGDNVATGQPFEVWDDNNHLALAVAPSGLHRPDLAIPLYMNGHQFTNSTTAFVTAFQGDTTHWQAFIQARMFVSVAGAGDAVVRMVVGGVQVDIETVPSSAFVTLSGAVPSFVPGTSQAVEIDIRRVGGVAGDIMGVQMIQCRGSAV